MTLFPPWPFVYRVLGRKPAVNPERIASFSPALTRSGYAGLTSQANSSTLNELNPFVFRLMKPRWGFDFYFNPYPA
jgi:hypothetical protein